MEQRMSAWETRRQFGKVLKDVSSNQATIVVESHGESVAAVISIEDYQRLQRMRQSVFDQFRDIASSVDMPEAEGDALAIEAMEWSRQQPDE